MAKRVTIEMVAREAGVSRGTVDRVINQRPHVRQDQRERVLAAIQKLGYEPKHVQARALGIEIAKKEVCRLGVVLPSRNPYYLKDLRQGIRDAQAQLADYSIEVITEQCSSSPYPEEVISLIDSLVEQGARGIALNAMDCEPVAERIDQLRGQNIPVVTFDSDIKSRRLFYYGKDAGKSGRVSGSLMSCYTEREDRILVAMGNREISDHSDRVEGFLDAMKRAGASPENIDVIETYGDYTLTYRKIRQKLKEGPEIKGIYLAYHSLTGCMDAVRAVNPKSAPVIIYSDMNERVPRYLRSGELDFCVSPNVYMMGYRTLILLKEYLRDGKMPEEEELFTEIDIVCRENVRE